MWIIYLGIRLCEAKVKTTVFGIEKLNVLVNKKFCHNNWQITIICTTTQQPMVQQFLTFLSLLKFSMGWSFANIKRLHKQDGTDIFENSIIPNLQELSSARKIKNCKMKPTAITGENLKFFVKIKDWEEKIQIKINDKHMRELLWTFNFSEHSTKISSYRYNICTV